MASARLKNPSLGIFLVGFLVTHVACQSSPVGFVAAPSSNSLSASLRLMKESCNLGSDHGSFAALLGGERIPNVQFEGAWSARFARLRAELVSPLGEPLAGLSLSDNGGSSRAQLSDVADGSGGIEDISSFLELVGSRNLRLLSCGLHLEGKIFTKMLEQAALVGVAQSFLSEGRLSAQGTNLDVYSEIQLRPSGTHWKIMAHSRVSSGFWVRRDLAVISWEGEVGKGLLLPQRVKVDLSASTFTLTFSDFE